MNTREDGKRCRNKGILNFNGERGGTGRTFGTVETFTFIFMSRMWLMYEKV